MTRRIVDFAGAVGAEQGEDLAPLHLEADVEEDLDLTVGEVDVAHLERGYRAASARRFWRSSSSSRILGDDQAPDRP